MSVANLAPVHGRARLAVEESSFCRYRDDEFIFAALYRVPNNTVAFSRDLRIVEKFYWPRRGCVTRFTSSDRDTIGSADLFLHVAEPTNSRSGNDAAFHLWRFPEDPELPQLSAVFSGEQETLMPATNDGPVTITLLKYLPLKRCVFSLATAGAPLANQWVGKFDSDADGARVFEIMRRLRAAGNCREHGFGLVEPVGFDGARKILWQRWCDGVAFLNYVEQVGLSEACRLNARALAAFHQLDAQLATAGEPAKLAKKLRARSQTIAGEFPELTTQVSDLTARVLAALASHPAPTQTTCHGDFNYSQMLFSNDGPVILDCAAAHHGDPLVDVGLFAVGLFDDDMTERFSAAEIQEALQSFCAAYRDATPWPVTDGALGSRIAALLISRRAYKVVTRLEAGAESAIEQFLDLTNEYLKGSGSL